MPFKLYFLQDFLKKNKYMTIRKFITIFSMLFFTFHLSLAQDNSTAKSSSNSDDDKIYTSVDEMPYLESADCDEELEDLDKKKCKDEAFVKYFYKHIRYPLRAKQNGIQGTVVISFVVEKDGSVTDVQVLKEIGAGCGQAAMDVIDHMEDTQETFVPGKQDGEPKRVKILFPVKFRSM